MERPSGFWNPWLHLALSAIFVTASELFLKRGALETAGLLGRWDWTGVAGLGSISVWIGIVLVILSFITWLYVLRFIPLNIAFPISQIVHVTVPLASWLWLHENITPWRWCGIALVLIGILVIAKPAAQLEERL